MSQVFKDIVISQHLPHPLLFGFTNLSSQIPNGAKVDREGASRATMWELHANVSIKLN
jgi:hypothetical protein